MTLIGTTLDNIVIILWTSTYLLRSTVYTFFKLFTKKRLNCIMNSTALLFALLHVLFKLP